MTIQTKDALLDEPQLSEGEKFIEEYFIEEKIKYVSQKIVNVSGDSKSYRVADFYLPKYEVYVEFFGRWNDSKEERERYRDKKNVYYKNRIPCIYLYPENLGILDHAFHYRMKKLLKEHGMKKQLRAYLFHDFHQQNLGTTPYIMLSSCLMFLFWLFEVDAKSALFSAWALSILAIGGIYLYDLFHFFKARE